MEQKEFMAWMGAINGATADLREMHRTEFNDIRRKLESHLLSIKCPERRAQALINMLTELAPAMEGADICGPLLDFLLEQQAQAKINLEAQRDELDRMRREFIERSKS